MQIPAGDRTFTLRTRADRIEQLHDGRYALLDYKTGTAADADRRCKSGLAPQLTLEGAILRQGGFEGIPRWRFNCGICSTSRCAAANPPANSKPITWKNSTPDAEADNAMRRLTELVIEI